MATNVLTNIASYFGVMTLPLTPFLPQHGGLIVAHPLNNFKEKSLPNKSYLLNLTINRFGVADVTDPMVQPTTQLIFTLDNSPLLQFVTDAQQRFTFFPFNNFIKVSTAPEFVVADNLIVTNFSFDKNIIITPSSTINVYFYNDESIVSVDLLKGYTFDYRFTYIPIT